MKNNYLIENEDIEFRRASENDSFEEIAELIYYTDPYIYPFWFNNDVNEAKKMLSKLLNKPGFIFNYNNIYVAYDKTTSHIIGILCALDYTINLDYDYDNLKSINQNYCYTINHYIEEILKEVKSNNSMYISNICIKDCYRSKKIGSHLMGYFISQMEQAGYDVFALDCLLHNLRAKNLYHSFGFKEMKEIIGFDGTDYSKIEVVSFLRKKGNYFPDEFQIK